MLGNGGLAPNQGHSRGKEESPGGRAEDAGKVEGRR